MKLFKKITLLFILFINQLTYAEDIDMLNDDNIDTTNIEKTYSKEKEEIILDYDECLMITIQNNF